MAKNPKLKLNEMERAIMRAMRRAHRKHFALPLDKVDRLGDEIKKRMMLSGLLTRGLDDGFKTARWVYNIPGNAIKELQDSYKEILKLELKWGRTGPESRLADFRASMNAILDEYWSLIRFAINMSGYYTIAIAAEEFARSVDRDLFPLLRKRGVIKAIPEVRYLLRIRSNVPLAEFNRAYTKSVIKEARRGRRKSRRQQWDFERKTGKFDPGIT